MNYRYVFHRRGKKQECPSCHQRTWRTYYDRKLNQECHSDYGICDRETNCAYHNPPKSTMGDTYEPPNLPPPAPKDTSWRCPDDVVAYTANSAGNVFGAWLVGLLGDRAKQALRMYRCGTYPKSAKNPHLSGGIVYWQIGSDNKHRSGKIMAYNPDGHRRKDVGTDWVHRVVYNKTMEELGCGQVLFGTHLLKERPKANVALVEAEKTAIIASCFYPDIIWLSTGGSHNLRMELCSCLVGANVTLFPDSGQYEAWSIKAAEIGLDALCESFRVDDTLEAMGADPGSDIGDYLLYPIEG